jgi:NTP pyrophosphatase (non-canonical NTP hydrolase)
VTPQTYQSWALHVFAHTGGRGLPHRDRLNCSALGVASEAGETVQLVRKALYQGRELSADDVASEAGDLAFYLCVLLAEVGLTLDDAFASNVRKLQQRYGEIANAPEG